MKIYISSSWKNRERVREMATSLTAKGHDVYDFTNPECRKTPEIPPEKYPEEFNPETHVYREYIQKEEWRAAVQENKTAIANADLIILLLPCGNDSHADWAYGVGLGKRSVVVGSPRKGDRSPVHMWADAIVDNDKQLYEFIKTARTLDNCNLVIKYGRPEQYNGVCEGFAKHYPVNDEPCEVCKKCELHYLYADSAERGGGQ